MTHWQKYGRAYLVGFFFFVMTNAVAFSTVLGSLTTAQIDALTRTDWVVISIKIIALASANILAYLNQTVAKAGQQPSNLP